MAEKIRKRLEDALRKHVELHSRAPRQRSEGWLEAKVRSLGGSEIAALLGQNPYTSRARLLAKKAGLEAGHSPVGVACWWGTVFEPVSEQVVEAEAGAPLLGGDIHVRDDALIVGHANSPDGYCAFCIEFLDPQSEEGAEGSWRFVPEPSRAEAEGRETLVVAALVELKSPYSRRLKREVPRHYLPQVLSGLALTPATTVGLYSEMVYRVCTLDTLGGLPGYSVGYHYRDLPEWSARPPQAWGAISFYAPKPGTRNSRGEKVELGAQGSDIFCYRLLGDVFGSASGSDGQEALDIGELAEERGRDFNSLLGYAAEGAVKVKYSPLCRPQTAAADEKQLNLFLMSPPPPPKNYYLLGFLGWKMLDSAHHLVPRDEGFLDRVRPEVDKFWREVESIRAAPDPAAQFARLCAPSRESAEQNLGEAAFQLFAEAAEELGLEKEEGPSQTA